MAEVQGAAAPLHAGAAMIRLTTAVGERIVRARAATGLTATQLQAMRLASDGSTMTALATALGLSKSTLTSVVDQLVTAKLAMRAPDAHDRRRQVVKLTRAGQRLLAGFDAEVADHARHIIGGLPAERRERLAQLLSRLPDPKGPIPLG